MDKLIQVKKSHPDAVLPSKNNVNDAGYDLTLIGEHKRINNVVLYKTGVHVQAPKGMYFDLVPRSSIIKTGYILANSVGIIDADYTGEILVPLIKIDEDMPDLEMPIRLMQLIPRKYYNFDVVEVDELRKTYRSDKGFGSSGK